MKTKSHGIIFLLICPVLAILSAHMTSDGDEFPLFFGIVLLVSIFVLAIMGICNITSHYNAKVCYPVSLALSIVLFVSALILFFGDFDSSVLCALLTGASAVVILVLSHDDYIDSKRRVNQNQGSHQNGNTIQEGHTQPIMPSSEKPKANPYGELYGKIYEHIYSSVGYICESETAKLEISTYCIFLFDILSFKTKLDRNFIQKSVLQYIKSNYRDLFDSSLQLYDVRITLYSKIFNRQIRAFGAWKLGDDQMIEENPVYASFIALCDILWNPDCVQDYENAPLMLRDLQQAISFNEKVKQAYISILEEINKSGLFRRPTMKP